MILRSVEFESFGKFRGQTVEFRRGLNLVIGPNEAGKSTLAESVPAVLFGTDRLERFKTWGRNACSATLSFEGQGRTVQIKRNLITDEVELVERDDLYHVLSQFSGKASLRGRSASCREYRALLESLLGVGDDKLFRATYFFGHHPQEWSGDELSQKLRTLVSGAAETDYAEVLDGLLDEHFQLTRKNPWGRDKQQDREYEEVCQQLTESGGVETVPVFVEIDNSADIEQQIEALSKEMENDHLEYEKGRRYVDHIRSQEMEATEKTVSPVVEEIAERAEPAARAMDLSEQLAAVGLPKDPPQELAEILSEAAEIRQELAALQQPYSLLNSREKKVPKVPWGLFFVLLVVICAGSGVAWWLKFHAPLVLTVAGICSLSFLGWNGWQQMTRKKALEACRKERGRLDQKKMASQQRQADLSERCEALRLPTSAIDLVRLQKLVSANRTLLDQYWAQGNSAETVAHSCPVEDDTHVQMTTGASREETTSAATEGLADADPSELRQLETRLAEFESELKKKEARLQELQSQRQELARTQRAQDGDPGSALQLHKRELEARIDVLRQAINLLAGAVDEFSRSHLVRLNEEAGKMFSKMTGGRYPAIRLDENMAPSVQVDGRRWMPIDSFSRGTVDAIYLALRMALAKVRDDGRSLPLMLDDPFVHLDQKRVTATLNLIDLASADGQLILFSHNLDLGKRAARERWHVVPLDGDSVNVSSEEGGEHAGQLHLL